MLKLTMIGNIGNDAEVRDANGQKVISFSVAHTEKYTDKTGSQVENTTWVRCSYWRPADRTGVAQYLKKGTQVYIEGFPSARHYQNKEGQTVSTLEVRVLSLELLGSRSNTAGNDNRSNANSDSGNRPAPIAYQDTQAQDDDLPF